ncbi:MAG: hypothetical protein EKK53_18325 [Burkholderiales bacterium]|nr:MAG: hypothetical protein EKK53_18325 [Burkholderiales bacterium]
MRANRMLYAPGLRPEDIDPGTCARMIRFADIPQPTEFACVAVLRFSLAGWAAAQAQPCERAFDELQGGWYGLSGMALPSGRYAYVQEFDHHPGEVHLHLAVWREQHLFRQDFFAAVRRLSVAREALTLCDGPYLWR